MEKCLAGFGELGLAGGAFWGGGELMVFVFFVELFLCSVHLRILLPPPLHQFRNLLTTTTTFPTLIPFLLTILRLLFLIQRINPVIIPWGLIPGRVKILLVPLGLGHGFVVLASLVAVHQFFCVMVLILRLVVIYYFFGVLVIFDVWYGGEVVGGNLVRGVQLHEFGSSHLF